MSLIQAANPNVDPSNLQIGQVITIPPLPDDLSLQPPLSIPEDDASTLYSDERIIGYFENWGQWRQGRGRYTPANIDAHLFTHINYAFAVFGFKTKPFGGPKLTGNYKIEPIEKNDHKLYEELQGLKAKNPKLKTFISIGGWSFNDPTDNDEDSPIGVHTYKLFSEMVTSPAGRSEFIDSLIAYAYDHGFDGVDLDWEYPGVAYHGGKKSDFDNFLELLQELRQKIDKQDKPLLLTIAAPAIPKPNVGEHWNTSEEFFEWLAQCVEYLDWVNIMSYDYHGAFDLKDTGLTGVNAPLREDSTPDGLSCVHITLRNYRKAHIPRHKIVLGMATYGRTYMLKNPPSNLVGPGQEFTSEGTAGELTRQPGVLSYMEIAEGIQSGRFERGWDENTETPYAYDRDSGLWITYDDEESLRRKAEYAGERWLIGIMFWAIGLDDFHNGYPLIAAAKRTFAITPPDLELIEQEDIDAQKPLEISEEDIKGGEHPWADVNDKGVAVQVYLKSGALHIRLGKHLDDGLYWWPSKEIVNAKDQPEFPKVALNNQNYFVVVMENAQERKNSAYLHYVLGKIEGETIHVLSGYNRYENNGIRPSVTLSDNNQVIEIHQDGYNLLTQYLYYKVGNIQGNNIEWVTEEYAGQRGREPDVDIWHRDNDVDLILEVHREYGAPNGLWYMVGELKGGKISWRDDVHYHYNSAAPSVAIDNEGRVVVVHKSSEKLPGFENLAHDSLWYRVGHLNPGNGTISWHSTDNTPEGTIIYEGAIKYANGETPCIALAGSGEDYRLVETHNAEKFSKPPPPTSHGGAPINIPEQLKEVSTLPVKAFTTASIPYVHRLLDKPLSFEESIGLDLESYGLEISDDDLKIFAYAIPKSKAQEFSDSVLSTLEELTKFAIQFVPIVGDIYSLVDNAIKCDQAEGEEKTQACVDAFLDAAFLGIDVGPNLIRGAGKALAMVAKQV